MKRVCLFCGARIDALKRRDALYCSGAHKQAAYRRRATALPPELWRLSVEDFANQYDDPDLFDGLEDLPLSDHSFPVVVVAYQTPSPPCLYCTRPIGEEVSDMDPDVELRTGLILCRPGGDYGPFCWIDCLVESAHTVR